MTLVLDYPEGSTPLDLNELEGLKHKHITTQGELNELEHANIQAGLLWLGIRKNPDILTDVFTLELHRRLLGNVWDWAGTIRTTEKNIGVDPMQISVQLRNLVDDAKAWLEYKTYPAAEAAIIFHHKLVRIHVFPNGNGRHARIMADALLEKGGVACLSGTSFGAYGEGYLRFSIANSLENLNEAASRMRKFLSS